MSTASTRHDDCAFAFTGAGVVVQNRDFTGDAEIEDVLKFSAAIDARIRGRVTSTGGSENACDMNNTSSVKVEGVLELNSGEQAGQVVKGGSKLETIDAGVIVFDPSPRSKCDLLVDDWSDQSQKASVVDAVMRRKDGEPVRVVWGRWKRPVTHGRQKVVWSWTIGLHVYNLAKGFVRWVLRIPDGVKGPSWM